MSAFIVSKEGFRNIYSGLRVYGGSNLPSWYEVKRNVSLLGDIAEKKHDDMYLNIVDSLYRLNVRAVNQRYNEKTSEQAGQSFYEYVTQLNVNVSKLQFLKSLECLLYQMSEGDVPNEAMYSALKTTIESIYRAIVRETVDYELAKWD